MAIVTIERMCSLGFWALQETLGLDILENSMGTLWDSWVVQVLYSGITERYSVLDFLAVGTLNPKP